ncbi:DNA gyrase/topoisomerase IV subunit A [Candidatus Uabimicrobium sp. HlEnr_7]|uniref:DNA gyrase/topoisomerase IV subunit A n=1 Tax=Candidatus Uabimicrobium helgolandensis TaxID=3095367 RepID=UPI0035569912
MSNENEPINNEPISNEPISNEPINNEPTNPPKSHLENLYENWFLDYASYVILERAVPSLEDGLKPVQRRILHSMNEIDDGRYHKVANIIGHTMQYHPHGDAAIGDALVGIGQKSLLVDPQGNWGDTRTGDPAAAARYIEARLTPFAKEIMFNPHVTKWQMSYDGRRKEPINLPVKFPLLLAQGVEGIAVGLATKIMPHNFNELLDASCDILRGKPVAIFPDFPHGGKADFSNYNNGQKGGKIRVRADIDIVDQKTLAIRSIPYGTTTSTLIDSIVKANDKGKIKIKKIIDNTAKELEIIVELPSGIPPQTMMDALYAFTNCEISISPNCCIIYDETPLFLGVEELLEKSTHHTTQVLKLELQVALGELQNKWHFASLEKFFIEEKIYRKIEECETWPEVISCIKDALEPFAKKLHKAITNDDVTKLTEIKIKRISKFNHRKAEEQISNLEEEIAKIERNLRNLTNYVIRYFQSLKKKHGKNFLRKTKIENFTTIEAAQVAVANQKLYVNRKDGFMGYSLKKDELVCECSDIDDIIIFLKSGICKVVKIADKVFVGKDILHIDVWKKNDERRVYNLIYRDGTGGRILAKRFNVKAITRDKEYDLTKGTKGSRILYFTANPNGETEIVTLHLHPKATARNKIIDFDFSELLVKGRSAQGNLVTKYPINRVTQKSQGKSTFGPTKIWLDEAIGQINNEERGKFLGEFDAEDLLLIFYKNGCLELTPYQLEYQYKDVHSIEKFNKQHPITVIHHDGNKKQVYVKRFELDNTLTGKMLQITTAHSESRLLHIFTEEKPHVQVSYLRKRPRKLVDEIIDLKEFIDIKGWKATGNRLSAQQLLKIQPLEVEKAKELLEKQAQENEEQQPKENEGEDPSNEQMAMF